MLSDKSNKVTDAEGNEMIAAIHHKQKIIIAEDQPINIQVIKYQLESFNIISSCEFCFNGEEVIELAKEIYDEAIEHVSGASDPTSKVEIAPISLMLLDF